MKILDKYKLSFLMVTLVALTFTSCNDDGEEVNDGEPSISYVRVTNPDSSDSLLVAAGQGNLVAIIGENLQNTKQVWFNNRRAQLSPNNITPTAVLTRVPSQIPTVITDQMILVFGDGDSLFYDFEVAISAPEAYSMYSEYVEAGDIAEFDGDYLYEPITVTFSGGVDAIIDDVEDDKLSVIVPEGAQSGPITITTNFGSVESAFWFRDNRFIFGSLDTSTEGWWHGQDYLTPVSEIPQINNNYVYINQELTAGQWFEFFVGNGSGILEGTTNIPDEAISNPGAYEMKFELSTLSPLPVGAVFRFYMGDTSGDMGGERNENNFAWELEEEIHTQGEWRTISLEFEDIITANPNIGVDPNGYTLSFWLWEGTVAYRAQFAADNFRVSPK